MALLARRREGAGVALLEVRFGSGESLKVLGNDEGWQEIYSFFCLLALELL